MIANWYATYEPDENDIAYYQFVDFGHMTEAQFRAWVQGHNA